MNQFAHLLAGLTLGAAANYLLVAASPLIGAGFASAWSAPLFAAIVLGALLPDIDHRKTKIFRVALLVLFIGVAFLVQKVVGSWLWALVGGGIVAAGFFLLKPRHRGITHKWPAVIAYCALLFALTLDKGLALSGAVAYASHLLLDKF